MNLWYRMSCTYDIVGPFRTYDIVYDMLKWQPTMSYVSDTISYEHVRHRTYILCRTYDVVRLYPVYRTYDIAHTIYNTMSCVARTMSYVMHVWHRTYVRHRRWQESRCNTRFKFTVTCTQFTAAASEPASASGNLIPWTTSPYSYTMSYVLNGPTISYVYNLRYCRFISYTT